MFFTAEERQRVFELIINRLHSVGTDMEKSVVMQEYVNEVFSLADEAVVQYNNEAFARQEAFRVNEEDVGDFLIPQKFCRENKKTICTNAVVVRKVLVGIVKMYKSI